MSVGQCDSSTEKLYRVSGGESALNDSDRIFDACNTAGNLAHTWQWQGPNSCGTSSLPSHECDCDALNLTNTKPCYIGSNASLRAAIAQYCVDDPNPYEYEIIDIQASPDTGHIMHPPDPCLQHSKRDQQSR